MKYINELIDFYKDQWKLSKSNADKYRENTKIRYNREGLVKENARMECFASFINNLVALTKTIKAKQSKVKNLNRPEEIK